MTLEQSFRQQGHVPAAGLKHALPAPGARPPAFIRTARLTLRPISEADAVAIYRGFAGRAKATRLMNFPRHLNPSITQAWAESCEGRWQKGTAFAYMIVLDATSQNLGSIELALNKGEAALGYILSEPFWGHGFATEAARALVTWAMMQPDLSRISATCHPDNIASIRVIEKAGLQFETRMEDAIAWPQLDRRAGPSLVFSRKIVQQQPQLRRQRGA